MKYEKKTGKAHKPWEFLLVICLLTVGMFTGCAEEKVDRDTETAVVSQVLPSSEQSDQKETVTDGTEAAPKEQEELTAPKYVFLFIGDGMSTPQIQLANYYLNAVSNEPSGGEAMEGKDTPLKSSNALTMMDFPVSGSAQTYNNDSFIPDSASTATAMASGYRTGSGILNMSEDQSQKYQTIAEKLKEQKGFKIGVVTSVNLNHATPAAFYAHQPSRSNYYEIGRELVDSQFDYFAGGALKQVSGKKEDQVDLYQLAREAGYQVADTQKEAEQLRPEDGKALVVGENLADSDTLPYELDRRKGQWALADYVEKGIELLDNEKGFFLMTEGGKIDWACHANDAATAIQETIALDHAVEKAVDFYKKHPKETLILVTGDHETGGLTLGYAQTGYSMYLNLLEKQEMSFAQFNAEKVAAYKKEKTDFYSVMEDITDIFGLESPSGDLEEQQVKDSADAHPEETEKDSLIMTNQEYDQLKAAFGQTMNRTGTEEAYSQEEYLEYGSYEPLTVTLTHILDKKSGIDFSSYSHTGLPVEVLAKGVSATVFGGYYENCEIFTRMAQLLGVKWGG